MASPHTTPSDLSHAQLLELRIAESGLSARRFATDVLHRDERTIRRWLAGDSPVPSVVLGFLENPIGPPWPGPSADELIRRRSEAWLRAIYRGDIAEARYCVQPSHVGDWLADFPIPDDLRDFTLRMLAQAHECLSGREPSGAAAPIHAIRRRWGSGPLGTPKLEDYLPSRMRDRAMSDNA